MRNTIYFICLLLTLACCKSKPLSNDFENMIREDLAKSFKQNVEIESLSIEEFNDYRNTADKSVVIMFSCSLNITDDVFDDKSNLVYPKGMNVKKRRIFFTYTKNGEEYKLTKSLVSE